VILVTTSDLLAEASSNKLNRKKFKVSNSCNSIVKDTECIQLDDEASNESNKVIELDGPNQCTVDTGIQRNIQTKFINQANRPFRQRQRFFNKNNKHNNTKDDEPDYLSYFEEIENNNRPLITKTFSQYLFSLLILYFKAPSSKKIKENFIINNFSLQ
jgi:macrodomain Ter protein organizer (MatP/YcbG family)